MSNLNITNERLFHILSCALEGGSNYWIDTINCNQDIYTIDNDYVLTIYSNVEGDKRVSNVTRNIMLNAISKMPAHHRQDFLEENEDAITGDVFLQIACFDEILYS